MTDIAYKTALKNAGGTETAMKISADTATKANAAILKVMDRFERLVLYMFNVFGFNREFLLRGR